MESVSYIELFYSSRKQEWCAVSYVSTFFGDIPPHFKQQESPFPSSSAKPFIGSTAYRLSAIRRFPFLAAKHSPSCRQRKRSLGFARDDDTGNVLSSFLLPCIGYSSRRLSFRAQREIFFVPFFPRLLRQALQGKHRPRLSCDTVFPISRCRARSLLPPTKKISRLRSG